MKGRRAISLGVRVKVWGEHALFFRPEMKVERCSYDIITPSAARGILEAIYWHPGMSWKIDSIHAIKPIQFTPIRRNEVKSKVLVNNALFIYNGAKRELLISNKGEVVQRTSLLLKDVEYAIFAHLDLTDQVNDSNNPGKFKDTIMRRLRRGEHYHTPYFSYRELPANFCLCEEDVHGAYEAAEDKDLGFMFYDMDYPNPEDIQPMFFRAVMRRGVVGLKDYEVIR